MSNLQRWSLGLLLMLTPLLSISCVGKDKEIFFVKILSEKNQMVEGDSCLLSVIAYAAHPFVLKECPEMLKIKNGRLRPLSIGRQLLQRVREHDRLYFACVVQQYVLRADKEGMVEIPEQNFKIELHIQEGDIDPLDAFFGRPVPTRKVVQKGENEVFKLKVIEKPLRTMEEMRKNGVEVI